MSLRHATSGLAIALAAGALLPAAAVAFASDCPAEPWPTNHALEELLAEGSPTLFLLQLGLREGALGRAEAGAGAAAASRAEAGAAAESRLQRLGSVAGRLAAHYAKAEVQLAEAGLPFMDLRAPTTTPVPTVEIPDWVLETDIEAKLLNATDTISEKCVPRQEMCDAAVDFIRLLVADAADNPGLSRELQLRRIIKLAGVKSWIYSTMGANGAYQRMDSNRDEYVSLQEFLEDGRRRFEVGDGATNITGRAHKLWRAMDRDRDRQVSRQDVRTFLQGVMLVKEFVPEIDPFYFQYHQAIPWNMTSSRVDAVLLKPGAWVEHVCTTPYLKLAVVVSAIAVGSLILLWLVTNYVFIKGGRLDRMAESYVNNRR